MLSMVLSCGLQSLHLILGMEVLTMNSFSPALCKVNSNKGHHGKLDGVLIWPKSDQLWELVCERPTVSRLNIASCCHHAVVQCIPIIS